MMLITGGPKRQPSMRKTAVTLSSPPDGADAGLAEHVELHGFTSSGAATAPMRLNASRPAAPSRPGTRA